MSVSVSELREGASVRVRGRVRRAPELLTSMLGKRACVYWEVRAGLADERPRARDGVDFWLEDATGRVLVRAERVEVDARAERRQRVLGQVDRDIHEVSERARVVKSAIRKSDGDQKALHAERRRLAELATLLCAVRAHARGRLHVGGSLAGQQAWIEARAVPTDAAPSVATLRLVVDEWEIVIEEGQELEVAGVCAREPVPGLVGSYREVATALVLRAPPEGALGISGLGEAASSATSRGEQRSGGGKSVAHAPGRANANAVSPRATSVASTDRVIVAVTALLCGVGVLLAWWLGR